MLILIYDNQIAGQSNSADNLPTGFSAVEYDGDQPIDNLWFDGKTIQVKPEQPSDRHYWAAGEWVAMAPAALPIFEDWAGLVNDLRDSGLFAKIYAAAKKTNKAGTAWTMLISALASPLLNVDDLAFAIADFRAMAPDVLDTENCKLILQFFERRGFYAEVLIQSLE